MRTTSILALLLLALSFAGQLHAGGTAHPRADNGADGTSGKAESTASEGEGPARTVQGRNDIEGEIIGSAAKGSPFAKLEIGMTQDDASDLVGGGKQCGAYQTGKQWIPFRFTSSDTMRSECVYKGLGRLIYTQNRRGSFLLKIINDASEDGVRE